MRRQFYKLPFILRNFRQLMLWIYHVYWRENGEDLKEKYELVKAQSTLKKIQSQPAVQLFGGTDFNLSKKQSKMIKCYSRCQWIFKFVLMFWSGSLATTLVVYFSYATYWQNNIRLNWNCKIISELFQFAESEN